MWARADLHRRWLSWVVLGAIAGVSTGIAAAAVAGARRTARTIPTYVQAAHMPDAGVVANDPSFDDAARARVNALPEVTGAFPFMVPFTLGFVAPKGLETVDAPLVPTAPESIGVMGDPIVAGRMPDPSRPDEIVIGANLARKFDLGIGATVVIGSLQPHFEQTMRVVGIMNAPSPELNSIPSSAFFEKYKRQLAPNGFVNEFVNLRDGAAGIDDFRVDVQQVLGKPVNVVSMAEIDGVPKLQHTTDIERSGLLLFALVVVVGAIALVGQALVRAVSAGAADLETWHAMGADRRSAALGMFTPALVTAVVGALVAVPVAVALSPRFPIAVARRYDLDRGVHWDWLVLGLAALLTLLGVVVAAWVTAVLRAAHRGRTHRRAGASWMTKADMPPSLLVGSRLATEPGRGRRAIPVRSALAGAIVGVLGFVGCLTFRAGLTDAATNHERSGIVWDYTVVSEGPLTTRDLNMIVRDDAAGDVVDAQWARAITVTHANRKTTIPAFGTATLKGSLPFVMLKGHAPQRADEIAFAPATMGQLQLHVGDTLPIGDDAKPVRVVGEALLPRTSHTDYDQSGWMTRDALQTLIPPANVVGPDFIEDQALIRWRPGADVRAAERRMDAFNKAEATFAQRVELPTAVVSLGQQRSLPVALAVFFALLASTTVAHAIVTTVRRRSRDLAILRSMGFTRRDTRLAIAWQATIIAIAGIVVGVPLGILAGRALWKQLAEHFPVVYAPPLALVAVLLVVPIALALVNFIAAAPAHAATRARPAELLRTE